jgi:DHA1 family bicyclomycin/chloramphenicol resistance-like MFS transporter
MNRKISPLPLPEFVTLLALMVSIVALATDIMLPALDVIGQDLGVADPNKAQLVISSLFLGFAIGQLLVGPISDSFGRKPVIYISYIVFAAGCILSMFADSFSIMLVGRVLQGLGAAGPRIVTIAIVRDGCEGRAMARIMSIVMSIFIIVPAIAPAIGQGVIVFSGWRGTFGLLLALAIVTYIWFALRQPETLAISDRRKFSLINIFSGVIEIFRSRIATGFTIAAGLIFGAFLGYLNSAQQIFQIAYQTGVYFALYFGIAAIAIGIASAVNARLVIRLGMRFLAHRAISGVTIVSILFLIPVVYYSGTPPFVLFMIWLVLTFFGMGVLFGNLNALAMEPLGHMAGLGAAFVGSLSTFISLPLGWVIGDSFDGSVLPLVAGFAVMGLGSLVVMKWADQE